jgi:DME family drug/metabolite transporter
MLSISYDRSATRRGLLLILLSGVLWGTVGTSSKILYGISAATPLSVGFFRLAISVPVLLTACWISQRSKMFDVTRHDLALMFLTGMTTAFYQLFYLASVERAGVAVATLITLCTAPIMVALSQGIVLNYSPIGWSLLVYLGVIPTALAYVLFITGMRHTTATAACTATLVEPLTSTILAWLVFGEHFSPMGSVGVALLAGSLVFLFGGGTTRGK